MLYLDSAMVPDALAAAAAGWVSGITTNPKLMAATGHRPHEQLVRLLEAFPSGPVFFQPARADSAEAEVRSAFGIGAGRVIAKLPAQGPMLTLAKRLLSEGHRVAITAVYSPAQAAVAAAVGAEWVIPYFDRAARLRPGEPIVSSLRAVLDALDSPTGILAASIKTPEQAVAALVSGARAISAPLPVLLAMAHDPLTESAVEEFTAAAG
jgi:TalC/MipB family fructose-6-phosphate aldolase